MARATKESRYVETITQVNAALNRLIEEAASQFPTTGPIQIDYKTRQAVSNDLLDAATRIRTYYAEHPPSSVPSREALLQFLLEESNNGTVKAVLDRMIHPPAPPLRRSPELATSIEEREMQGELRSREMPTQEQPAVTPTTRPRRTSVPTITELRQQGYGNVLGVRVQEEGPFYLFASNDLNLDIVGMTFSQMVEYAKSNPGAMRIFELNERGRATKELRPSSL